MGNHYSDQQIKNRVNLYFDKALNQQESADLLNQVNTNTDIQNIFDREKKNRDLLKSSISRHSVPSNIVQTIMKNIKH